MRHVFYRIAEMLRPLHDNGLGKDLQLPENPSELVHRGTLLRMAQMSVAMGVDFWIFEAIGPEYAHRAVRAWRPRELLLMEDVSLAFHEVDNRTQQGISVSSIHIDRLLAILLRYFAYLGETWDPDVIRSKVSRYIADNWRKRVELADNEDQDENDKSERE